MKNILLNFYQKAKNKRTISVEHFQIFDNIECLTLICFSNNHSLIGITEIGEWYVKTNSGCFLLNEEKHFFKAISIVEMSSAQIEKEILTEFKNILEKDDVYNIFPFYDIVKYIFSFVPSQHWFELAYTWFVKFNIAEQKKLIPLLENKILNKNLPQQLRHKIRKDISYVLAQENISMRNKRQE